VLALKLSLESSDAGYAATETTSPPGASPPVSVSYAIRPGRPVRVHAETIRADLCRFLTWNAPGLMIHGSENPVETFAVPEGGALGISASCVETTDSSIFLPAAQVREYYNLELLTEGTVKREYNTDTGDYLGVTITAPKGGPVSLDFTIESELSYLFYGVWEGYDNGITGDTVVKSSGITLPALSELEDLEPAQNLYPLTDTLVHYIKTNVGWGSIRAGGLMSGAPRFTHSLVTGLSFTVSAFFSVAGNLAGYLLTMDDIVQSAASGGGTCWTFNFRRAPSLNCKANAPCMGYVTAAPARKYYPRNKVVEITAHALPGYQFKGWFGLAGNVWETAGEDDDGNFTVTGDGIPINEATSEIIYVRFDTLQSKIILSVFEKKSTCLILLGLDDAETKADIELAQEPYCYRSTTFSHQNFGDVGYEQEFIDSFPENKIFCYAGHSGGSELYAYLPDADGDGQPDDKRCYTLTNIEDYCDGKEYKLAFMNCCKAGSYTNIFYWGMGFKADCVVGWDDSVHKDDAVAFDNYFWSHLTAGESVSYIVATFLEVYSEFSSITTGRPNCIGGEMTLDVCDF
jgi:hypothetical protein